MRKAFLAVLCAFLLCSKTLAADSGPLVRSGFSGVVPTANQTWVFNTNDLCLYGYDGTNWQKLTPGRIQNAGIGAPTSSNDSTQGYTVGSFWFDSSGLNWYVCLNNTASAAVWNVFTNRVAQTDINNSIAPKFTTADIMGDFVASGLLGTVPASSLTMTTPLGVAYVTGIRTAAAAQAYTYPVSKDTYDYLAATTGIISHSSVANNAGAPVGPTGLLIQKVVTNGTAITAVTQIANVAPVTNVGMATASTFNAINIFQADGRYATFGSVNGPFTANKFLASPNGSTGASVFRSIVSADLPVIAAAQGGTGSTSTPALNSILIGNGTAWVPSVSPPAALNYLRSNAANTALEWAASAGISSLTITDASSYYAISPSPLTSNGTITLTPPLVTPNYVLAGPSSGSTTAYAAPRLLVSADCPIAVNQLRLYCPTGAPYGDSTGSSSTTLFIGGIPTGNQCLFQQTAGNYQLLSVPQTAVTMSGNTANVIYDTYIKDLLGTVTVTQAAWSSNTPPTRGTDSLGRLTKNGDTTSLLIGCYRAVAATTTVDTASSRWVSNVANPIKKIMTCRDTTATVTPTAASTWVIYNANTTDGTDRFSYVQCIANYPTWARNYGIGYNNSGSYIGGGYIAIGFNSTTAIVAGAGANAICGNTIDGSNSVACEISEPATVGYNYFQRMYSGVTASTYYADPSCGNAITPASTAAEQMIGEIFN